MMNRESLLYTYALWARALIAREHRKYIEESACGTTTWSRGVVAAGDDVQLLIALFFFFLIQYFIDLKIIFLILLKKNMWVY